MIEPIIKRTENQILIKMKIDPSHTLSADISINYGKTKFGVPSFEIPELHEEEFWYVEEFNNTLQKFLQIVSDEFFRIPEDKRDGKNPFAKNKKRKKITCEIHS